MLVNNLSQILEVAYKEEPNKLAVEDGINRFTYKDLRMSAVMIQNALVRMEKQRQPVVVLSERDCRCIALFWGIIYSGNFYVALNAKDNAYGLASIIQDINPIAVCTVNDNKDVRMLCKQLGLPYICYSDLENVISDANYLRIHILSEDPAYMVMTSGSTGTPKGVIKTHRSVLGFLRDFDEIFSFEHSISLGNQSEFDYDVSAKDIFLSVYKRGKMSIISKKLFLSPSKLVLFLYEQEVDTLIWSVAAMRFLANSGSLKKKEYLPKLSKVFFSGEEIDSTTLKCWIEAFPCTIFVNLYAPSEITGNCLYYIVDNDSIPSKIPLGQSFPDVEVFLLNEKNELCKDGEQGEICVRGSFLASGYYKNNKITGERFIQNPLNDNYIDLVYKTGDMAKYDSAILYYEGRNDYQIKHRGHRIELYEIESNFLKLSGLNRCCCTKIEDKLVIFFEGSIQIDSLKKEMKMLFPGYKVPDLFVELESLPTNERGKIDRAKIKEYGVKINERPTVENINGYKT